MTAIRNEQESQLSRRFRPALMAFFLRRIRNHAEAEDLTQEVFMRLMNLPADRVDHPDAYIFQIAANLLRDQHRREKVRAAYQIRELSMDGFGVEFLDPDRVLSGRQALERMIGLLGNLPERTRTIFLLYRVESMKKADIAAAFGMTISGVNKHLIKAMTSMMAGSRDGE
jgi:RNA polymerase sigma factor (sigma-70 family)